MTVPLLLSHESIDISDVTIRGFQESDAAQVKALFRAGMESLLPSFHLLALLRSPFSHMVWSCCTISVVICALSNELHYLIPIALVMSLVYTVILILYLKHRLSAYISSEIMSNLVDIPRSYEGGVFLIAVYKGSIIGMVGGEDMGEGVMSMKRMSVDVRIHSRGLGTLLVQSLHNKALQLSFSKITLATTTAQQPAIRLYRKSGYNLVRQSPLGIPGTDLCIFEKYLKP